MKKTVLILLFVLPLTRLSAQTCDTATFAAILKQQVAMTDKFFDKQPYVLKKSTVPFNPSASFLQPTDTWSRFYAGNTHFSEWGGSGRYFFYEKRGRKWKLVDSSLVWIS
jgi:hypothetical protein